MLKRLLILFVLIICTQESFSQILFQSNGARSFAMAGCALTASDIYSGLNNQATMAFNKNSSIAISSTRKFNFSDLSYHSFTGIYKLKNSAFGLSASYNGISNYNNSLIGLSYARLLSQKISVGIQFDYLNKNIAEYGSHSAVTFEAGFLYKASKQLDFAVHTFNPIQVQQGFENAEKYPSILAAGITYKPAETFSLSAEVNNSYNDNSSLRIGAEYKPVKEVAIRAGINNNEYCFGLGIKWKNISIDLASTFHRYLSLSSNASIAYEFGNK
jgi:hypothetical protein